MSITDDGNYVCDFCRGMSGEFSATTGNHVSCEEIERLEKVNKLLQSTITDKDDEILRLRELLKEVADNSMDLVCEYSDDPHNHTSGCPKDVIGIYQNKPGDCICGYEAKFAKHTTLMEKLKQEGIE
jgi:hypothetical protein